VLDFGSVSLLQRPHADMTPFPGQSLRLAAPAGARRKMPWPPRSRLPRRPGCQMLARPGTRSTPPSPRITSRCRAGVQRISAPTPTPSSGTAGSCMASTRPVAPRQLDARVLRGRKAMRCALEYHHRSGLRIGVAGAASQIRQAAVRKSSLRQRSATGEKGFLVSPTIAGQWEKQVPELKAQPGFAEAFMPGGRAPRPGERFSLSGARGGSRADREIQRRGVLRGALADNRSAREKTRRGDGAPRIWRPTARTGSRRWQSTTAATPARAAAQRPGVVRSDRTRPSRSTSISPRSRSDGTTACTCRSKR